MYPHIPSSLDFSNTFHLFLSRLVAGALAAELSQSFEQGGNGTRPSHQVSVFSMWNEDLCLGKLGKVGPVDIEIIGDLCPCGVKSQFYPMISFVSSSKAAAEPPQLPLSTEAKRGQSKRRSCSMRFGPLGHGDICRNSYRFD